MPAQIAENMLANGPGCVHLEVGGKKFPMTVGACVALVTSSIYATNQCEWGWRAEIFGDGAWDREYTIGHGLIQIRPAFELAMVPFTRAWQDIVERAWRTSLWREHMRMAEGLDAYDEDWLQKLNAGRIANMVLRQTEIDGGWRERDMQIYNNAMRREWINTPEGFFENQGRKKA